MKNAAMIILSLMLAGLLFTASCKKTEKQEPPKKEEAQKTAPTEPAPVPPGTPKY